MRFFLLSILLLSSCTSHRVLSQDKDIAPLEQKLEKQKLVSVHIIDRNGLSETISTKDRLSSYEQNDFFGSQPYQKVLRVFARDKEGKSLSIVTSYYSNGQIKQYLEAINGRAFGRYLEWHENGQKKLLATVVGGNADIDEKSQNSWAFDSNCYSWNEEGIVTAKVLYDKGSLEGTALYFHADGSIAEEIPYSKGEIDGEKKVFDEKGAIIESSWYKAGRKEGKSVGFWAGSKPLWVEVWHEDLLQEGVYTDKSGNELCRVVDGNGKRSIFDDEAPSELQEYKAGKAEGEVLILDDKGQIERKLYVKNNKKHGEELFYWPGTSRPRLSIEWYEGNIHGRVTSWYENGTTESQREMSHNTKQGHLSAWYRTGELMLIEEYEKDRLVRGDYLKKGETTPVSKVVDGTGIATFFDADGTFVRRVEYKYGKPIEELN